MVSFAVQSDKAKERNKKYKDERKKIKLVIIFNDRTAYLETLQEIYR